MIKIGDELNGKSILLTGGTGFIGKNLLNYINRNSIQLGRLTIITRNIAKFQNHYDNFKALKNTDFIETNINDLKYNGYKYDYLIHAATSVVEHTDNLDLLMNIVHGTDKIFDFALRAEVKSCINFSSGAIYGKFDKIELKSENSPTNLDITTLKSTYGVSKIISEHLAYLYASKYQLNITTLRCFSFSGDYLNSTHYVLGEFILKAIRNESIIVNAGKNVYRSYLHVQELIDWMFHLLLCSSQLNTNYQVYNVGSDEPVSIANLAFKVRNILGSNIDVICPGINDEKIMYYVPDISKIRQLGLNIGIKLEEIILSLAKHYKTWYR